jgi:hypothetical protein
VAYTKHTWVSKEKITASLLNNMEAGIEAAHKAAAEAQDATELRAAFDLLSKNTSAMIRQLDARITALESK